MTAPKPGADWKPTAAGILLPPGAAPSPVVERAEFAVKVRGFAQTDGWEDVGPYTVARCVEVVRR